MSDGIRANRAKGRPWWWACGPRPSLESVLLLERLGIDWREMVQRYKAIAERLYGDE